MTTVIIELEQGLVADYLHDYEVLIDGESYGRIKAGESFSVQLRHGMHSVKFRTVLLQSPVLKVFVGYSRTRITGRANMWRAMGLFELFAPEEWVRVQEEMDHGAGMMLSSLPEFRQPVARKSKRAAKLAALLPAPRVRPHPHFASPDVVAP